MVEFTDEIATRGETYLNLAMCGPSGGGKSLSSLRVATGITSIWGGEVFAIDTTGSEQLREYAERYRFRIVPFKAPHSSARYLEALKYCQSRGAKVVIVDSGSDEHEGEGGYLDYHLAETDRMARGDQNKYDKVQLLAWGRPKGERRKLIQHMDGRLKMHQIWTFRTEEKAKPVKKEGSDRMSVENQGWSAIAGAALLYELRLRFVLPAGAKGVPLFDVTRPGEKLLERMPDYFESIFKPARQLDEKHGELLAQWAKGARQEAPESDGMGSTLGIPDDVAEAAFDWCAACDEVTDKVSYLELKKKMVDAALPEPVRAAIRPALDKAKGRVGA